MYIFNRLLYYLKREVILDLKNSQYLKYKFESYDQKKRANKDVIKTLFL